MLPNLAPGYVEVMEPFVGPYFKVLKTNSYSDDERNGILGAGKYGTVYHSRCYSPPGGTTLLDVAIKEIKKLPTASQVDRQKREVEFCGKVKSSFVVHMWGSYELPEYFYVVMELIPGGHDLEKELQNDGGRFGVEKAREIFQQLVLGLTALHQQKVVHRDLKPDNVLFERAKMRAVITDFSFINNYNESGGRVGTECGSPPYAAPEVVTTSVHQHDYLPEPADVWSLGVMLHQMLCGQRPFATTSMYHDSNKIYHCATPAFKIPTEPAHRIIQSIPHADDLLSRMLNSTPGAVISLNDSSASGSKTRISLVDIIAHPFFKGNETNDQLLAKFSNHNPPRVQREMERAYNPAEILDSAAAAAFASPGKNFSKDEHVAQIKSALAKSKGTATDTTTTPSSITLLFHGTASRCKNILFGRQGIMDQLHGDPSNIRRDAVDLIKWGISDGEHNVYVKHEVINPQTKERQTNGLKVTIYVAQPVVGRENEQATIRLTKNEGNDDDFVEMLMTLIRKMRGLLQTHPDCLPSV